MIFPRKIFSHQQSARKRKQLNFVPIMATGGTIITASISGSVYAIHTFVSVGTSSFNISRLSTNPPNNFVDYFVLGGGGSGGGSPDNAGAGGGGGSGGLITGSFSVHQFVNTVIVGSGGMASTTNFFTGSNGENSSVFGFVGYGGGFGGTGGGAAQGFSGQNGGSGGGGGGGELSGGGTNVNLSGSAIYPSNLGEKGGLGVNSGIDGNDAGGGGGGLGVSGSSATAAGIPGKGGDGIQSDFDGTMRWYGGGGAGGKDNPGSSNKPLGGQGGGGDGGHVTTSGFGEPGEDELGAGGGGGSDGSQGGAVFGRPGGNGGTGRVMIRYPLERVS